MSGGKVSTKEKGRKGESLAMDFLEHEGYTVIERNFRKAYGEVDIISVKDDVVTFTEVKSWGHIDKSGMEHALNRKKTGRIVKVSRAFLMENPLYNGFHVRYDIIFIGGDGVVTHIPSAFTENEIA